MGPQLGLHSVPMEEVLTVKSEIVLKNGQNDAFLDLGEYRQNGQPDMSGLKR